MTDVSERLGVHRTTVQRWLKQYNEGGIWELLKIRYSPGRRGSNPLCDSRRTLDKN
jgi:transposase